MRKTLAVATAALILLGGAQLPAWAAGPPAPTDIEVSWVDAAAGKFKVTWKDGGEENYVRVEYEDDTTPWVHLGQVRATAPNEFLGANWFLRSDKVARIIVVARDEAGVVGAGAVSPWFDTNRPASATFSSAASLADASVRVQWYRGQPAQDTTPNDPLDRPVAEEQVLVGSTPASGAREIFPFPAATLATTLPPRPGPRRIGLGVQNEWGSRPADGPVVQVTAQTAAFGIPAVGQYLSTIRFTAEIGSPECVGDPCGYGPVYLQARADARKPWATIGRYNSAKVSAAIGVYGGRQYRLYVPAWSYRGNDFIIAPPISTSARSSAAQAKFAVAGFNTSSAAVGQLVRATVSVLPAGTVKASLQWYDGKAWHPSAYIPLAKGKGTFTFKASGRGTTRYWRVVVPKMSMNGLPILATPSKAFKLTVR